MASPRQGWRIPRGGRGRRRGFVPIELLLVLLVAGLAGVLVLTVLGRIRQRIRVDALGATMQATAAAVERYRADTGRWPATPGEIASRLPGETWPGSPAVGGEWGWIPPATEHAGRITLTAFAPGLPLELTRADLLALDRRLDDGDPGRGRLRTGFNGWPVYLVGEQP